MKSQGWQVEKLISVFKGCIIWAVFLLGNNALSAPLTIREVALKDNSVEIQMDGVLSKGAIEVDYIRDIVQFSLQNTSVYPAKILHAENQNYSKVFAYQYAPNLVRVRFTVDGNSKNYQGKVKYSQNGKSLTVTFPPSAAKPVADSGAEKSLIAKVLGRGNSRANDKENAEKKNSDKKIAEKTGVPEKKTPLALKPSPGVGSSILKTLLAMMLVVGGLGAFLFYLKRKQKGQVKSVAPQWFGKFFQNKIRKTKSLIEVVAQHSLGARQSITVVRIRGQQFVLGVSPESVQLISQIDSDESEIGLLDDPIVADSIGKMFGGRPQVIPMNENRESQDSFSGLLKTTARSIGTHAYQAQVGQAEVEPVTVPPVIRQQQSGIRDQIRRRLEGMKSL